MKNHVRELLNQQINMEFGSAYLYLDFSEHFDQVGLHGFAHWFRQQAQEEISHGMRIVHYLDDCGEIIGWQTIEKPIWHSNEEKNCKAVLEAALQHEEEVTRSIEKIYAHAEDSRDLRTMNFLQWFIAEQREEEKQAADLIRSYQLCSRESSSCFLLDHELGKRKNPSEEEE